MLVLPTISITVVAVDEMLKLREEMNLALKGSLYKAQNRMKQMADMGRSEREFVVGD